MSVLYIKKDSVYTEIINIYKKVENTWSAITQESLFDYLGDKVMFYGGEITDAIFEIAAPYIVSTETCQCLALLNREVVTNGVQWSIESGSTYATIDSTGLLTVLSGANMSNIVLKATYQAFTATQTVEVSYKSGSTSETTSETTTDESGNTVTTTTTITTNEDGTSASTSTIITYNESGTPIERINEEVDTEGNIDKQGIEYDEQGNEVVTAYTIDTSNNPDGEKEYNANGVNTEYYAFDLTNGFIIDFDFTFNYNDQPLNQDENHHNILTMKRATPSPWYGFQIRQTSNTKNVILGTQFATGSNTNTSLSGIGVTIAPNTDEFNLRIIYNPTASTKNFVCIDMNTGREVFTSNNTFPDIEELKYLKVTIGYAMDANGDPYRYSNINVKNFLIQKLPTEVIPPVVDCDGESIVLTCETIGSDIYYRLNETGSYVKYTEAISISADTVVEAYARLSDKTSTPIKETCIYTGIEPPMIDCDGKFVTISCETPSADIYYRLNETGTYSLYTDAIEISGDTIVEAYSSVDGKTSGIVKETCIYSGLKEPVISCDGEHVTITCETVGANIYYRINQEGIFEQYTEPITITADTVFEAYSVLDGDSSSIVIENCIYNPVHDYSKDYLTFRVTTPGVIAWNSLGTGQSKTIQYSLNDGEWTSITASSATTISVVAGDVIRFKGNNASYAKDKTNYSGFDSSSAGTAAYFNIEGNIMSLVYGDNFSGNTAMTGTYNFCSIFKRSQVVSAENLILPATTLTNYCYRAMFSWCESLVTAPALPATTLAQGCYWYMFEKCAITTAPVLPATTMVRECYGHMFTGCTNLNYVKCLAENGINAVSATTNWLNGVASSGTFVKSPNANTGSTAGSSTWVTNTVNGIPRGWTPEDDGQEVLAEPVVTCDGEEITITCDTLDAQIYYNLNQSRAYTLYTEPIPITGDTSVDAYSTKNGEQSTVVTENCVYNPETPFEKSNKVLSSWTYNSIPVTTPYSVNRTDGHSSSYAKGTFNFDTTISLKSTQPTYLWFQHADQSATISVDNNVVEKHWGGYNAFFVDISEYAHKGLNNIRVALKNNEGNYLAPCAGDFNFNATLGNVKLFTSPVLPAMEYGYDGFHITSTVSDSVATIYVKTKIPTGATVTCGINDGTYSYGTSGSSTGDEMIFSATVQNPHLWNGTADPHLYTVTLEIYHEGELYHRYQRPYGLRYYSYVINDTTVIPNESYTGFLLNGSPYQLRGVCMHDDIDGKANALSDADYTQTFSLIQELGCNFIRLAHYPHPKEVYDWCDQLGIVVQTEVPCVNKLQSTLPSEYYTHLEGQYADMVNQHYNHPCIMFWGLSNETTTDDKDFAKTKIEQYTAQIKALDSERLVGYVMSHSYSNPSSYYNNPNVDWFGCNIYVGWYIDKSSNNPTSQLNTRVTNIITNTHKALAFSEYGAGGTQHCHSEDPQTTTTKGNYERHDIEYQMWLHEGHIAAIRNFPQLLFTAEWQLFDIAVSSRNEGYTVCLDGETTSIDDDLRRLNDKGLVERDHITKKDSFYIYKAEWSDELFVHICGKDYTRMTDRVIKCYTNDGNSLSLYVNDTLIETVTVTDHIATFTSRNYSAGDVVRVEGGTTNDTFTF